MVLVGESCAFADGPAVAPITHGQQRRVDELGWQFRSLDASLSPERQAQQIDELIDLDVDGLTSWTLDADLCEPAYRRAASAGIPIVTFNSETPSAVAVVRQGTDTAQPAEDAARYIADRVPAARIIVVGGPPIPALAARVEHFLAACAAAGLRVAARDDNVGDIEETATPVVEALLERHPDADAIWCFNDYTAVAAGKALCRHGVPVWSGRTQGVIVSGIGGAPLAIAAIRDGTITLTYDSMPVDAGRAAIDLLETVVVRGEQPPPEVRIDCARCDASNVASFVPWHER